MASEQCEAIHLTRVERDYDCDNFMPELDPETYRLWSASAPRRDNGVRTAFQCYTRAGAATRASQRQWPVATTSCRSAP